MCVCVCVCVCVDAQQEGDGESAEVKVETPPPSKKRKDDKPVEPVEGALINAHVQYIFMYTYNTLYLYCTAVYTCTCIILRVYNKIFYGHTLVHFRTPCCQKYKCNYAVHNMTLHSVYMYMYMYMHVFTFPMGHTADF